MMLYDQRIEYFKQEGYVLGWKGVDLLKYRKSEIEIAYGYLQKSVDLRKARSEEAVIITLMQTANVLYKNDIITEDDIINTYIKLSEFLAEKAEKTRSSKKTQVAIENIEKIFTECGAADCESIAEIFTPKYEASPEDPELLEKIALISEKNKCTQSELYFNVLEELLRIEPSSTLAAKIAQFLHDREEYLKCIAYFKKAIDLETDNETKAKYYIGMAQIYLDKIKSYAKARDYAYEAIKANSKSGDPYILIGNAYIAGSDDCSQSDFEQRAVYWAAVDKYKKAKSVDPSLSQKASKLIEKYSDYFPLKEEAFFNGYLDGQEYTVGGWINEKTIVRTKEN
jgi:tetratricopeptide (TPR) repeat protein